MTTLFLTWTSQNQNFDPRGGNPLVAKAHGEEQRVKTRY